MPATTEPAFRQSPASADKPQGWDRIVAEDTSGRTLRHRLGNLGFAMVQTLYEQVGGFDRILALTLHWHRLCLADPDAAHPFECHDMHPHHDERLAAYLAEALGGPPLYTAGYGDESYVQRIHAGNGTHVELDEACLRCFDQALADVGITGEAATRFSDYFRRATEAMRVYGAKDATVPDDLPFNRA